MIKHFFAPLRNGLVAEVAFVPLTASSAIMTESFRAKRCLSREPRVGLSQILGQHDNRALYLGSAELGFLCRWPGCDRGMLFTRVNLIIPLRCFKELGVLEECNGFEGLCIGEDTM